METTIEPDTMNVQMWIRPGHRGCRILMIDNYTYNRNRQIDDKTYWLCGRKVRFHDPINDVERKKNSINESNRIKML